MKKAPTFRTLAKELSRDPRLKKVMARAGRQPRGRDRAKVEQVTGLLSVMLTVASRFSKKKRARAIEDLRDAIDLLVQASLLLKENVFDRPEVKRFFKQRSKELYSFARGCVEIVVPKKGRKVRPTLSSKAV